MKKIFLLCWGLLSLALPAILNAENLVDTTGAIITNVRVPTSTLFPTSAEVKWSTDDHSDSRVLYYSGVSTAAAITLERCDGGGYVTSHCVVLRNLVPATTYQFKVESMNTSGLDSHLSGFSFTTLSSTSGGGSSETGATTETTTVEGATSTTTNSSSTFSNTESGSETTYLDVIAPYIVSFGTFWESDGRIRASAVFSEPMSEPTLIAQNIFIMNSSTGKILAGSVNRYSGNLSVDYVTTSAAEYNMDYQLIVKSTVTDLYGNRLIRDYFSPSFRRAVDAGTLTTSSQTSTTTQSTTYATTTKTTYAAATTTSTAATSYGTLEVLALDQSGKVLPGTYLYMYKATTISGSYTSFSGKTDSTGIYKISVPTGNYVVEAHSPSGRNDLAKPPAKTVSVLSGAGTTVTMQFSLPTKTLTGSVKYSDGSPVKDAGLSVYSVERGTFINAPVESTGAFVIQVSAGAWKVRVYAKNESGIWSNSGLEQDVNFSDGSAETKFLTFTLPLPNAKLTVIAVDENGVPVKNAGINVSTARTSSTHYNQFAATDSLGKVTFSMIPGSYTLRGTVSLDASLNNPPEQVVTLASEGSQSIKLIFAKKTEITTVAVSGKTTKDKVLLGDVSVFAWSDDGGVAESRSNSEGFYAFRLKRNTKWHLSAGKIIENRPYKSDEQILDITDQSLVREVAMHAENVILPSPESVTKAATEHIVTQTTDGARMSIFPSAVSAPSVTVEVRPTIEAPSQAGAQVVSTVYDITVKDQAGKEVTNLASSAEITLPYSESDLKDNGIGEDDIAPSYFDKKTGSWVRLADFMIDKVNNRTIAKVSHLTRFAIVAPADVTPPSGPTRVTFAKAAGGRNQLAWTNPAKDFDHSKIYRSTLRGTLGDIIVPETAETSYVDVNATSGKIYYYTVRSVDPAGNESVNTEQVSGVGNSVVAAALVSQVPESGDIGYILEFGQRSDNIKLLQIKLRDLGFYPEGYVTGYFGSLTRAAVIRFQDKYKAEVLTPAGFSRPTGMVGSYTAAKLNQL
ncbi:MAG: peptidoglycan-binding protein [Candidatus Taylorbacteria bacterium]|nr:peptidoglycan-binding protein [Candidatus Taylorbacteria bacterium]